MTQTSYKAWDGHLYEWPPPEGWYQADDGRWWPAGYGPQAEAEDSAAGSSQTEESEAVDSTPTSETETAHELDEPSLDREPVEPSLGLELDEPSLDSEPVGPLSDSAAMATDHVDFGPGLSDWPNPETPEPHAGQEPISAPEPTTSFPPVERPSSSSILGESLPPSDYDPGEVQTDMPVSLGEPAVAAPEASVPDAGVFESFDASFVDTGNKQGPASFPPPPVGSAQVYSGPDQPDPLSPFEMAVADQDQAEPDPTPSPGVGDSLYPPDLATSRLPATPTFDDAETIGGDLPLNEIPTGNPPSLANPTFSEPLPSAPTEGLGNAGVLADAGGQPWGLPGSSQVASNIQPSSLPSTEDFVSAERENSSGSGRDKKILLLLAGLVLVAAALFLGSRLLSGDDDESAVEVAADSEETVTAVEPSESDDGSVAAPSESTDPDPVEGTFSNPHRRDFEVDISYASDDGDRSWRIAVQSPVAEAEDAGTPGAGNVFAVADVRVRNQQPDTALAVNTLQFNVATESGDVIRWSDAACTSGDPLGIDDVLASGEETQGSLCWEVPAESLESLLLRVETSEVSGQVFIELN